MRRSSALLLATAFVTASTFAATENKLAEKAAAPADEAPVTATAGAPLAQTAESATDSPLVRAAKRANAARRNQKSTTAVITDKDLKRSGGHFTTTTTQNELPGAPTTPAKNPTVDSGQTAAERAANAKKVEGLKNEQGRMGDEMDQPYGGDVSEDQAAARMSQIPGEISKAGGTPTSAVPNSVAPSNPAAGPSTAPPSVAAPPPLAPPAPPRPPSV